MRLPDSVLFAVKALNRRGYAAYVVGGAVRSALLGAAPRDYDICTDAVPEEIAACFPGQKTVMTNRRFGAVSVPLGGLPVDITTFRTDGSYVDHRRPGSVTFGSSLREDLRRRDFTVNAIAFHPDEGYIDPFGGIPDLECRVIRAVGDAGERFSEDALRILRALRFSAALSFEIERRTEAGMLKHRALIARLSAERVQAELSLFLTAESAGSRFFACRDIWFEALPEIRTPAPDPGRLAEAVDRVSPSLLPRLAALFCDAPAWEILSRLRYPKKQIADVCLFAERRGDPADPTPAGARRALSLFGERMVFDYIDFRRARSFAGYAPDRGDPAAFGALRERVRDALNNQDCFRLPALAVGGGDLLSAGFQKKSIGNALSALLGSVIAGETPNTWPALMALAERMRRPD